MRGIVKRELDRRLRTHFSAAATPFARLTDDGAAIDQAERGRVAHGLASSAAVARRPDLDAQAREAQHRFGEYRGPPRKPLRTVQQQSQQKQTANMRAKSMPNSSAS